MAGPQHVEGCVVMEYLRQDNSVDGLLNAKGSQLVAFDDRKKGQAAFLREIALYRSAFRILCVTALNNDV